MSDATTSDLIQLDPGQRRHTSSTCRNSSVKDDMHSGCKVGGQGKAKHKETIARNIAKHEEIQTFRRNPRQANLAKHKGKPKPISRDNEKSLTKCERNHNLSKKNQGSSWTETRGKQNVREPNLFLFNIAKKKRGTPKRWRKT